jgi:Cu/Ag efflux protein CusF
MTYRLILALAATAALAACGPKTPAEAPPPAPAVSATPAPASDGMSSAAMAKAPAAPINAKGVGTVTAVDKAAGTVTLDHEAIPEANWPAMTMAFKAAPAVLGGVKVGDHVAFDLKIAGGAGEVTAIRRQ